MEGPNSPVGTMSPLWKYSSLKCAMESDPPHEMTALSGVSPCTKDWCLSEVSTVFLTSTSKTVLNMRRKTHRYFSVQCRPVFSVLFLICTFHAAFQVELNMKYTLLFSQNFIVPLLASKYCWVLASMCVCELLSNLCRCWGSLGEIAVISLTVSFQWFISPAYAISFFRGIWRARFIKRMDNFIAKRQN